MPVRIERTRGQLNGRVQPNRFCRWGHLHRGRWAAITATSADPEADSELAVIAATPTATPITRPDALTVAIAASLDSHENSALRHRMPVRIERTRGQLNGRAQRGQLSCGR